MGLRGAEQVTVPAAVIVSPESPGSPWIAAGRGLMAWPELAERCRTAGAIVLEDLLPHAREILSLAIPTVAAGQALPPELALPIYVRDRVVQGATS